MRGSPGQSARQSRSAVYESTHVARWYRVGPCRPARGPLYDAARSARSMSSSTGTPRARSGSGSRSEMRRAGTPAQTSHGGTADGQHGSGPEHRAHGQAGSRHHHGVGAQEREVVDDRDARVHLAPGRRRDRAHRRVELLRSGQDAAPLRHARVVAEARPAAGEDRAERGDVDVAPDLDAEAALDAREVVDAGSVADADRLRLQQERLCEDLDALADRRETFHELLRLEHARGSLSARRRRRGPRRPDRPARRSSRRRAGG